MKTLLFFLSLCSFTLNVHRVQAQDVRSQLRQIANDLSKQLVDKGKKRIVIASFLDLKNQETELGRYMADKFSISMGSTAALEITDRSQLSQLLRDNKLGAERILDPKTTPNLSRITGAEVIVTGNYTALDNSVDITIKAIDLERGVRLAVAEGAIPRTSEINKLLSDASLMPELSSTGSADSDSNERGQKESDKRCATNHTGTYCFQNTTKVDIKISLNGFSFTIHPGQTECQYGLHAGTNGEYAYPAYVYRDVKEGSYETRQIVVTECVKKLFVVR